MISQSIQSLVSSLGRQGIEVIIGGGLAVNAHGFSRFTSDADLTVSAESRNDLEAILAELGFVNQGSTNVSTRFRHSNFMVPFIDLLWTEPKTFSVFLEGAVDADRDCKVLSLPHLIAMKIHAISQNEDRMAKDSEDIRWLLNYDASALSREDFVNLINRFASDSTKDYLIGLYPAQLIISAMDILNLDPRTFPRDNFGPPLGGMPMDDYEKWIGEMNETFRDQVEKNPPPQPDGEPFTLFPKAHN